MRAKINSIDSYFELKTIGSNLQNMGILIGCNNNNTTILIYLLSTKTSLFEYESLEIWNQMLM